MIVFLHLSNQDIGAHAINLASKWFPFQCSKTNKYEDLFFQCSLCHIINLLLIKLVRSRWLGIGLVLFLRFYGPRLRGSFYKHSFFYFTLPFQPFHKAAKISESVADSSAPGRSYRSFETVLKNHNFVLSTLNFNNICAGKEAEVNF